MAGMASITDKNAPFIRMTELFAENASNRNVQDSTGSAVLEEWPSHPQPLVADPMAETFYNIYDILLCLIPLVLLTKTILCIVASHLDSQATGIFVDEASLLTTFLIQFNNQIVTAFTIVFVTIMTTFMHRLALWRAQKGESVATLEQYQASVSLPSTIKAVWSLRAFSITSVALVVVWSFYYLGSQASKREYTLANSTALKHINGVYIDPSAPSVFETASNATVNPHVLSKINFEYNSAVLFQSNEIQSSKGFDYWGSALVPWLDFVTEDPDRHGWVDVSITEEQVYASDLGTAIWVPSTILSFANNQTVEQPSISIQPVGDYTYNTSYFVVNCTSILTGASAFPNGTLPSLSVAINVTGNATLTNNSATPPAREIDVWYRLNETDAVQSTCNLTISYVEVQIHCGASGCVARKMRPTAGRPASLRTPFDDYNFAVSFYEGLLLSSGVPSINVSTVTESSLFPDGASANFLIYQATTALTQLTNTYYAASQDPANTIVNLTFGSNANQDQIQALVYGKTPDPNSPWRILRMKGAAYNPQYALSVPWIVIDFISCQILFLAAVAALWLRKHTLAPDIFGYVSSLTRDNPNLSLPDGGTTLSGIERARLMKNVKIRIADVGPSDPVGRIGLSYARSGSSQEDYLKKEKRYA